MITNGTLSRLVPPSPWSIDELEANYPERALPAGAEVTRFGPSPTGYVHVGSILVALMAESVAKQSGGVFILRIEDTDRNRFVEDAIDQLRRGMEFFSLREDEGFNRGDYGPYFQSERSGIYDTYIRHLLGKQLAYPCFCSKDDLATISDNQRSAGVPTGYWGQWARCRNLSESDVTQRLDDGSSFVIRFRAPEFTGAKIRYQDIIRGELEIEDNRNDIVIRKSMGLPTYHMAHAVDDHLMRVTTVIRADEWISSVPVHLQLFSALGFDAPTYAHIAPLVVQDGKSKRKLSKRKDPEANVDFYAESGYPAEAVLVYLRGLANSRLQDQPADEVLSAPIRLDQASRSGQLLDLVKLDQISRDLIAEMSREEVANRIIGWAEQFDPELFRKLASHSDELTQALAIEESAPGHVRKDLSKWNDFAAKYGFLVPCLFELVTDANDERFAPVAPATVSLMAESVAQKYNHDLESSVWFNQIRDTAAELGFAKSAGDFKREPEKYRGAVRDAANVIRVLLTGSTRSPDLFEVKRVLGSAEVRRRLSSLMPVKQA